MNRYSIFFLFVILIFSTDVLGEGCQQVPTCKDLGFVYQEDACYAAGMDTMRCPFEPGNNNKVYCPEDCSSYTLDSDSCDTNIGTCSEPCLGNGKVKYTSCTNGYMLLDGNCEKAEKGCVEEGFTSDEKDPTIGEIEYCWNNGETLSRYKSCKKGWQLTNDSGPTCSPDPCDTDDYKKLDENCADPGSCIKTCPHNADCSDICYSGTTKKVKITCNDGLFLQRGGDKVLAIEEQGADEIIEYPKCRKHPIGNIAFYCKEKTKISELASKLVNETKNTSYLKIDDDEDQIISLKPEYYDIAIDYECEAIGVVFDNNTKTKIVGLKDIGYDSGELVEQRQDSRPKIMWSNCFEDKEKCNVTDLDDYTSTTLVMPLYTELLIDGSSNTDAIIAWAKAGGYTAPAAQVTRDYYPRLSINGGVAYEEICPENSACGKGKWYLPSVHELKVYNNRQIRGSLLLKDAFDKIEEKNFENSGEKIIGFTFKTDTNGQVYVSSNENNNARSLNVVFTSGALYASRKDGAGFVRPVLVID